MAKTASKSKTSSSSNKSNQKSSTSGKFSKETYLHWYETMLLMRKFEEKAGQLYIQQKIRGFCHLYIGQEALVVAAVSALKESDNIITAYRDHTHPIGLGMDPKYVMAELYGKESGCSKGKGGSMHMFDKERNFFGGHGIVGGQIPLGAGIAFAEKYRGNDKVTLCYMGDGAVRQGSFHETMNMAMNWKLPVVFIIENNNYAMGTSVERVSNVTDLHQLADSYNMTNEQVDGMSCEPVYTAIEKAVKRAREGEGPTLLEMRTYRYKGHSMSDPAKYRTKEELEEYKSLDPIENVLATIKKKKYATEKQIGEIQEKVKNQVKEAIDFAEKADYPDPSELYKDVYHQEDYPFIKE